MPNYVEIRGDSLADERRNLRRLLIDLGIWPAWWPPPTAICVIAPPANTDTSEEPADSTDELEENIGDLKANYDIVLAEIPLPPDPTADQ